MQKTRDSIPATSAISESTTSKERRKTYQAPKVYSAEPLEVTASTCNEAGSGSVGKTSIFDGGNCDTLGS